MARWQQHARLGLGLFAVVFAAVLWAVMGERQAPAPVVPIERLDPKAVSEIRGGDVVQVKGAKRDISVTFGSQISYADGHRRFTSFAAHIDDRGGRSFIISGNEASVGNELSSYDVRGDVTLKTSDGLTATTPHATFTEAEGIVRGSGPVQFQRARVTGSGVGFSYDRSLDRLWLQDKAVINVAPAAAGGGMKVASGAAGYSRAERYMRFERGMHLEREGQVMESEHATVFLLRDRDEPEHVELRGSARITGAAGTGSLQAMQARDINLHYAADGRTLQQALLMGQGAIHLARPDGSAGQQLHGETIDTALAPDGAITRLLGRDQVRVMVPATADAAARTITSQLLEGSGEPGRGLTTMSFQNDVEYREDAATGGSSRVARSPAMKAALSTNGAVDAAEFQKGFRFEEGRLVGTSLEAEYHVAKGMVTLRGGSGRARPRVTDERVTIDADRIDLTLAPRQMDASGSVRNELASNRRREGDRHNTLLRDNEIVVVTASGLIFDEATGKGTYEGQAHVFQASGTSIRGDTITMDERQGSLTAVGNVISTLPIAGRKEDGPTGTSLARAGEFRFDDAKRLATFSQKAQLDGVQGNLHAERIELFLAAGDNTLERLEAHDAVSVTLDKRKATGQRLTYHPSDERYVLTGSPVRLLQECQESSGRTLTFYKASDRIQVDGAETRVQTKGGKCAEPTVAPR